MNFLKSDKPLSILNFLMMSLAVATLESEYIILVSLLITSLFVFEIKSKYALMTLTVLLFTLSDIVFLQTDPQYEIKKNIAELINTDSLSSFLKICVILLSLFALWQIEKKISKIKTLNKNLIKALILFILALATGAVIQLKNINTAFVVYVYLILVLIIFRSMQIAFDSTSSVLNYAKSIIPPFFDNGWYKRHKNENEALSINFKSILITKKIFLFSAFQIIAIGISKIYLNKNMFGLIDILQINPELIILESYSKIKIVTSIFLVGLQYIAQVLSFSLFAECAYLVFGFELNSQFKFNMIAKSYSSFISGILPMQTQFLKEVVLYPLINQSPLSSMSSIKFYIKCFIYIFIFGFILHFIRNYFLFYSFDLNLIFIRSVTNDFLYFGLIFILIFSFRKFRTKNKSFLFVLNVFFIFTQGVLIYLKRNFLFTSEAEKLKVIWYAFFS